MHWEGGFRSLCKSKLYFSLKFIAYVRETLVRATIPGVGFDRTLTRRLTGQSRDLRITSSIILLSEDHLASRCVNHPYLTPTGLRSGLCRKRYSQRSVVDHYFIGSRHRPVRNSHGYVPQNANYSLIGRLPRAMKECPALRD